MTLNGCPQVSVFTLSVARTMLLEELTIESCDSLKCLIIDPGDDHAGMSCVSIFPKLKYLFFNNCSELEFLVGQYHYEDQNHDDVPALKETTINSPTNMITISPTNYYAACASMKEFSVWKCPQFMIKSISNFTVDLNAGQLEWTSNKDLAEIEKHLTIVEHLSLDDSNIEGIFYVEGVPMIGQQSMSSGLKSLWLVKLPEMRYICRGPKHIMYFQNLEMLRIEGCKELEVMLSASVLTSLPQLTYLHIKDCENLEKIIEEENKNTSNFILPETKPCFPRLKILIVQRCNKLKALFSISTSYEFPELKFLIINKASQLEKAFEAEVHLKVEFPKLKYMVLAQLNSLIDVCQGIQLQNVTHRFVHDCPKLFLDSTTTNLRGMEQNYRHNEGMSWSPIDEMAFHLLYQIGYEMNSENPKMETSSQRHEDEDSGVLSPSKSKTPSSQINTKAETEDVGEVPSSEIQAKAASATSIPLQNSISQHVRQPVHESSFTGLPILPTLQNLGDSTLSPISSSTHSELDEPNETSLSVSLQGEIRLSQTETHIDRESKTNPINAQDLEEDDLIRLIQIMEKGADIEVAKPFSTAEFVKFEDNLVFKAFTDLEATLKTPLNEIADSEEKSLRLKNALGVLSSHCCEDAENSTGFKATIDSMNQEFQSIISSFKQASATIDKFTELEKKEKSIEEGLPQQKDAAITLISDICETEKSMTEALRKEAVLKEQITRLQAEIKDFEIKLSSLREQKKKRIEDTIELVKEFEGVKKDKSQMVEDQIKARQQLDKVNDNWSSCVDNLRKTTLLLGIYLKQRI